MSDELFLILHKVRSEPAFDIAHRMRCPVCEPIRQGLDGGSAPLGCDECDGEGFWWIIPTSGHRAYPFRWWDMEGLRDISDVNQYGNSHNCPIHATDALPSDWPDHYPDRPSPTAPRVLGGILSALGLRPKVEIKRRKF